MADAEYFRQLTEKCLRLSRMSYDMETSRQLRLMAAEFLERAEECGAREDFIHRAHKNCSEDGDMDRD